MVYLPKRLAAVAAVSDSGVIGNGNSLPWNIPEDMKRFQKLTWGHTIIMGRKTHESIGKALPGRLNLVLSRGEPSLAPGARKVSCISEALELADKAADTLPMVIGGSQVYKLALPCITDLFITEVHKEVEGTILFPEFNPFDFDERSRVLAHTEGVEFVHLERKMRI